MSALDKLSFSPASSPLAAGRRRAARAPFVACGGLALLVGAQSQMQHQQLPPWSMAALAAGLALWVWALWAAPPPPDRLSGLIAQDRTMRWMLVVTAVIFAVVTWFSTAGGVYTVANVATWLAAVGTWCWAWWPRSTPESDQPWMSRRGHGLTLLALTVIVVVGAFFRFYRLSDVPADPTSDHAEKLLDVLLLVNGERPIFFPRNTGREPGQFYITFGLMRVFGLPLQFETLKFGTALIGLLTVPAVFLFAQELAGRTTGLIAAALFAVSKWPVNTARMGLRFPYGPLPTALVLWLLLRYLRRADRRDALLCGIVIGLGLHGYISFRIVPLLVPLAFGVALVADKRWRQHWRLLVADGLLIASTALLMCLPLARYTVQHPDQVWYRVATRTTSAEQPVGQWSEQFAIFARNNLNALHAFNWRGDSTIVNAVQYDPFLDLVTGAALLAGLIIVGYQISARHESRYGLILLAAPVLALPSTLNVAFPIENPSANRMGTLAPLIIVVAALPFGYIVQHWWRHAKVSAFGWQRVAAGFGLAVALLIAAQQNYVRYFHDYDQQYRWRVQNTHEVAQAMQAWQQRGVPLDQMYMLAYPHWLDGRNIALALGDINWQPTHDLTSDAPLPEQVSGQPLLFVLHSDDTTRQAELSKQFPHGQLMRIASDVPHHSFTLYVAPAR